MNGSSSRSSSPTLSDSELLEGLDDDFDYGRMREQRLEQLKSQATLIEAVKNTDHGRMITMGDEKALIEKSAKEPYCLIHFYHPDFAKCKTMDSHLEKLAPKYPHTLFLRISVASVPFLVERLKIKILPCVIPFVHGQTHERLIGFEELGNGNDFQTSMLEMRLRASGVLPNDLPSLSDVLNAKDADEGKDVFKEKRDKREARNIRQGTSNLNYDSDD